MLPYIIKRVIYLIPILFIVSIIVFSIIHITPGDPAAVMLGEEASPEEIARLQRELGLDLPTHLQYINWIQQILKGDLGSSFFMRISVGQAIMNRLEPSLSLAILAQIIAIAIGIPLGIAAATHKNTATDRSLMVISLFGISIPSFLLGLFLMLLFSVYLGWLPVAGYQPLSTGLWNHLRYMLLPAVSLGVMQAALIARMTRSSMIDVLNTDYIRTARSKGVKERMVIYKHALRNAFIPILTIIGQIFGTLISRAVVVEQVFGIPGIGQMIVQSVARRDFPMIQGTVLFVAVIFVLINLGVDLMYGVIDPRVRLTKTGGE